MRSAPVTLASLTLALAAAACSSKSGSGGGGAVKLCAASNTGAVAADASGIYWAQTPATGSSSGGAILHLALPGPLLRGSGLAPLAAVPGGTPQVLVSGVDPQGSPFAGPVLGGGSRFAFAALGTGSNGNLLLGAPIAGGTATTLAGAALGAGGPVTADASFAYQLLYGVLNTGGITVIRAPLDGHAPATVLSTSDSFQVDASGTLALGVAVDSASIYWLANVSDFNSSLYRAPLSGGSASLLAENLLAAEGLVLDDANLYVGGAGVTRVPKDGGPVATLASSLSGFVTYPMAIDGGSLYFTFQPRPTAQNIQRLDLASGAATTIYSESCLQAPCFSGLAASGGAVYWADGTGIFKAE